jgi:DNA-binding NarL/FixJ family response regulator
MDIRMPELDGLEATKQITSDPALSSTRILVLTTFELDEYVFGALSAGASGFLLKGGEPTDLLSAIRLVAAGEALLAPSVTKRLIEAYIAQTKAGDTDAPERARRAHPTRARDPPAGRLAAAHDWPSNGRKACGSGGRRR